MNFRPMFLLLSLLCLATSHAEIEAVFDACRISPATSLIDFESEPIGATMSPADIGGVTFAADALGVVSIASFGANGTEVEDQAIAPLNSGVITSGPYLPMTLTFATPVAQAGFGIWDLNVQGNTLAAFDTNGGVLDTVGITDLGAPGGGSATFIGFVSSDVNIAQLVFTPASTGEFYVIDNLVYTDVLPEPDADGDCVSDTQDNCVFVANTDQRDSNGDSFGNACDADLNNDCIVNAVDLGLLRLRFFSADADADFNGDGVVNATDLGVMRVLFFQPPGPSALGACTIP